MTILVPLVHGPLPRRRTSASLLARSLRAGLLGGCLLVSPSVLRAQPAPGPSPRETPEPPAPSAAPSASPSAGKAEEGAASRQVVGRIRGTVLDPKKKPVTGVMVLLSSCDQSGLLRVTGTDENGQYLFQDLPAGTYAIEIGSGEYGQQKKDRIQVRPPFQDLIDFDLGSPGAAPRGLAALIQRPAGTAPPPAALTPAATPSVAPAPAGGPPVPVRGTLLDQQRGPVAEVSVTFVPLQGSGIYQALSAVDGRFTIPSIPPGRYRVLVASPGHVPLDLPAVEVSPASGLDLSLTLVDYPLNSRAREDDLLPREQPRALPAPSPAPSPSPTPAPPSR